MTNYFIKKSSTKMSSKPFTFRFGRRDLRPKNKAVRVLPGNKVTAISGSLNKSICRR